MGISREQALDSFRSNDLVGIGMEADAVRRQLHREGVVGYTMESRIDCAVLADGTASAGQSNIDAAIAEAVESGASCIRLLGCESADRIEDLLRCIRHRFPRLWIEAFSTAQLQSLASTWGAGLRDTLARLTDAGLDSIADEGVPLIDSSARSGAVAVAEWIDVHRTAHAQGMRTVAAMIFGSGETAEQRVEFLHAVRRLHEETGGFAAFAPIAAEAPGGRELDGVTAVERLKTLAIARMFLDNIDNVQASATPQGLKVLQASLRFGANDVGPVTLESGREEDIRRIIRDAGFRPAPREMGYRALSLS
jgi:cyclic dehypoxanthinyl futalosine synthase